MAVAAVASPKMKPFKFDKQLGDYSIHVSVINLMMAGTAKVECQDECWDPGSIWLKEDDEQGLSVFTTIDNE